ncbi:MAG: hypothetical protein KDE35_12560 [Geminicoccaceae bacterium]|nr:hypothetical protein [Geminicoccaceae bacterium]
MIHEPPILTIRRNFVRPDRAMIERFAQANACWIADAMDGRAAAHPAIKPVLADKAVICGPALTCHCGVNANLALLAAIAMAEKGDVIVAATDGFTGAAVIGDRMAGMARNRGVAAVVTDGATRDQAGLRQVGLPIFAAAVNPNSCIRDAPGTVGLPVMLGGRHVAAGDLVVADEDGVTFVPRDRLAEIADRLDEVAEAERALAARVEAEGLDRLDLVVELLASDRVIHLD